MQQLYQINTGVLSKDIQLIDIQIKNSLLSLSSLLNENKISEALKQKENINSLYEYKTDLMNGDNRRFVIRCSTYQTKINQIWQRLKEYLHQFGICDILYEHRIIINQMDLLYPEDIKQECQLIT